MLSRFSLWRIDRDLTKCTDCDLCLKHCEGASDPHAALRKSECFVCFNCIDDCPEDALSFRLALRCPSRTDIIEAARFERVPPTLFGKKLISQRVTRPKSRLPDVPAPALDSGRVLGA